MRFSLLLWSRLLVPAGLLLVFLFAACGDAPLLDLTIVTPEGPDPLAQVDAVRVTLSNPREVQSTRVDNSSSFELELEVEVDSAVGIITLEGMAGKILAARGETPPLILRPEEQQMSLLVARAGALSTLRPRFSGAAAGMVSVLLVGKGVLLAGGTDATGKALAGAAVYDFFDHQLTSARPLPAARSGAVAVPCGNTCAVVALGGDATTLSSTISRFDGSVWKEYKDDGLDPGTRRRDAGIATLSDGSYLVAGGSGLAGALDTLLRFDPGDTNRAPGFTVLGKRAVAARKHPAVAAGISSVVIGGGQAAGGPVFEVFYLSSSSSREVKQTTPAALAGGAAAAGLSDGEAAFVGGRDSSGKLLRDAWIVDPTTLKVTHIKDALARGRADHQLFRVGSQLVVLGGVVEGGLADRAEVLDAVTLKNLGQPATQTPRSSHVVQRLGQRSLLMAGGLDAKGAPVDRLEVWQTSELLE